MAEKFEDEVAYLTNFLKNHSEISNINIDNTERTIILDVKIGRKTDINWEFIQNVFGQYFNVEHEYNIQFNYIKSRDIEFVDTDDIVAIPPPSQKPHPIISYSTDKEDWRLFRFYNQDGKDFTDNYFAPSREIANKEMVNLENTYHHILEDMKKRMFTKNVIELNINCLNDNELKDNYIEALRGLPIQLKNRIAISLVRIPKDVSIHALRQAALICKLCTDNIFLSLPFNGLLDKSRLEQIYGISGYIVTVPEGTIQTGEDVKKVYDKLTMTFRDKRTFVIIGDKTDLPPPPKNKILTLHEREKIGVT